MRVPKCSGLANSPSVKWIFGGEREIEAGESRDDSGFGTEDQFAQGSFVEGSGAGGGEFGVGPPAFRADGKDGGACVLPGKNGAQGLGVRGLGEKDFQCIGLHPESSFGIYKRVENGHPNSAGLLRGFQEDLLPAGGALGRGREKGFLAAFGGEGDDAADAEFGGFFESPFESIKFDDGKEKGRFKRCLGRSKLFEKNKFDFVARDPFNAGETNAGAVAEFVELAGLRAKDAADVVGSFALHQRALILESIDEEAATHG